jgi:TRAP-type C4-dicarboxylate transport system permease large subunit
LICPSPVLSAVRRVSAATETSVGKLFMAAVVPGILLGVALMVVIYIVARIKKLPAQPRVSIREWLSTTRWAFWGLLLLVIILASIYVEAGRQRLSRIPCTWQPAYLYSGCRWIHIQP